MGTLSGRNPSSGAHWSLLATLTVLTIGRPASGEGNCIDEHYAASCILGSTYLSPLLQYNPRDYLTSARSVNASVTGATCLPEADEAGYGEECVDTGDPRYEVGICPGWVELGWCTLIYDASVDWSEWMEARCCNSCRQYNSGNLCKWDNPSGAFYAPEWDFMCVVNRDGTKERCDAPMCHTLPYCDKYKWMQDAREDTSVPASVAVYDAREFILALLNPLISVITVMLEINVRDEDLPDVPIFVNRAVHIYPIFDQPLLRWHFTKKRIIVCTNNCYFKVDLLWYNMSDPANWNDAAGGMKSLVAENGGFWETNSLQTEWQCDTPWGDAWEALWNNAINITFQNVPIQETEAGRHRGLPMFLTPYTGGTWLATDTRVGCYYGETSSSDLDYSLVTAPSPPGVSSQQGGLEWYVYAIVAAGVLFLCGGCLVMRSCYARKPASKRVQTKEGPLRERRVGMNHVPEEYTELDRSHMKELINVYSTTLSNLTSVQSVSAAKLDWTAREQMARWNTIQDQLDSASVSHLAPEVDTRETSEIGYLSVPSKGIDCSSKGTMSLWSSSLDKTTTTASMGVPDGNPHVEVVDPEYVWTTPSGGDVVHNRHNRYTLVQKIGEGTHAICFTGKIEGDPSTVYCLKISKHMNAAAREMFMSEVSIMGRFTHPHIAQLYECFEFKRRQVIVMSYYARGDIASALMEGDTMVMGFLSNQGFACAIAQLCIGLDHIHSMKIAHRDIKLDNIFISDQGQLVFGDFGASREILDVMNTFAGTPLTMAPEVLNMRPYDLKSDIYSLGASLYVLCTQTNYIEASTIRSLLFKHANMQPEDAFERAALTMDGWHLSDDLRGILISMLMMDPEKRPTARQILAHPLINQTLLHMVTERRAELVDLSQEPPVLTPAFLAKDTAIAIPLESCEENELPEQISERSLERSDMNHQLRTKKV